MERGRCATHRVAQWDESRRGNAWERGYTTASQKASRMYGKRHPLCERCEARGIVRLKAEVHHRDQDRSNTSDENLESLCFECHDEETARQSREGMRRVR